VSTAIQSKRSQRSASGKPTVIGELTLESLHRSLGDEKLLATRNSLMRRLGLS
jgi:hypothetical protein